MAVSDEDMKKVKQKKKSFLHATRYTLHAVWGFTLIEMLVSISIFSFVMLATTAVLLSVVDANYKAQGLKTSINNLNMTLESMARNLRTGSRYWYPASGVSICNSNGRTGVGFIDHNGYQVQYRLTDGAIEVSRRSGPFSRMTAPEINISRLCFYISGNGASNTQPRILITMGGVLNNLTAAGAKTKTTSRFDIQTFVSQRLLDN